VKYDNPDNMLSTENFEIVYSKHNLDGGAHIYEIGIYSKLDSFKIFRDINEAKNWGRRYGTILNEDNDDYAYGVKSLLLTFGLTYLEFG